MPCSLLAREFPRPPPPAPLGGRRARSALALQARRQTEFARIRQQYPHVQEGPLRHACDGYWVGGGAAVYGSFADYQRVYRPLQLGPRAARSVSVATAPARVQRNAPDAGAQAQALIWHSEHWPSLPELLAATLPASVVMQAALPPLPDQP